MKGCDGQESFVMDGLKFGNISTRSFVQTGNDVMIAGVIVHGPGSKSVLTRALGPTLGPAPFNLPNSLPDPFLDLREWQQDAHHLQRQLEERSASTDPGCRAGPAKRCRIGHRNHPSTR